MTIYISEQDPALRSRRQVVGISELQLVTQLPEFAVAPQALHPALDDLEVIHRPKARIGSYLPLMMSDVT